MVLTAYLLYSELAMASANVKPIGTWLRSYLVISRFQPILWGTSQTFSPRHIQYPSSFYFHYCYFCFETRQAIARLSQANLTSRRRIRRGGAPNRHIIAQRHIMSSPDRRTGAKRPRMAHSLSPPSRISHLTDASQLSLNKPLTNSFA